MKRIYTLISLFMAIFAMSANAQTWDFSGKGVPDVDVTNLNADATNWKYDTKNNRWGNVNALENAELTANGKTIYFTDGLLFTAPAADNVRIDAKKNCLTLNNSKVVVKIKNLRAGFKVIVKSQCSSPDVKRTINATNVTSETFGKLEGVYGTTLEFTGEVTADGDITLQPTGGMYIHLISVVDPNEEPAPDPSSFNKTTNSVFKNANNNQMQLTLSSGENFYYNTAELKAVNIDGKKVLVESLAANVDADYYDGTLSNIQFFKGQPTGAEAQEIKNGGIVITEAKGWLETAYIKFTPTADAKTYNVYVKGGQFSAYTKIDGPLVRNYGTYGRADMVGLPAGSYDMKVVAVDESGNEIASSASEALGMTVKAYDRRGFAHFNMAHEIGAYDETGKLLSNAVVIYVTAKNAKTVEATVLREGKMQTFTGLQAILDAYQKKGEKTPIAIRLIGKISKADLDAISSSAEGLQIKAAENYGYMPITVEGIGDDATVHGFGFLIRNCGYVEMRNFAIMDCLDDCVSMDTNNEHLWIHNLDLFYGATGGDADQAKGDGTLDIKGNSRMTTMAYNHLWDSGKASLCGMGGDSEEYISYIGNWFDHSDSRHPRVRCMTVHVLNNYYDGVAKYGAGATTDSDIFVEGNYFRNTKYPMLISKQGSDIATDSKGTFSGEAGGMIKSYGNKIIGATRYVTYQQNNTQFDAYEAATRDEKVPATVKAVLGGATYNNFDTDASKIYSYEALAADDVPGEVTGWTGAGRLGHGDFKWNFTNADDKDYSVNKALKSAIQGYQSSLVGIFGGETINPGGNTGGNEGGEGGNTGGNEGGEGGGQGTTPSSPTIDGPTSCNFVGKACSNPTQFTVSGSYSNSKGTATYKGTEYKYCLKMESATSVKFKTSKDFKLVLVFASTEANNDKAIKVNGTAKKSDANGQVIMDIPAGDYELTKGNSTNLFFIDITE